MRAIVFFCVLTVVILISVFLLLRSLKLKEKYAVLWALVGLTCLILVAFPKLLIKAAHLVGIQVGSNLLFTLAILLLIGICLQLSLEVSSHEDKLRRLAEEVAILRAQLDQPGAKDRTHETPIPDRHRRLQGNSENGTVHQISDKQE